MKQLTDRKKKKPHKKHFTDDRKYDDGQRTHRMQNPRHSRQDDWNADLTWEEDDTPIDLYGTDDESE